MPGGDRTGPMGAGSMTGRRAGYCSGFGAPGFANPMSPWRGFGYRYRGGGWGWQNMYSVTGMPGWQPPGYVAPIPQEETASLKEQAKLLKDQFDAINKRIEELEQK